MLTTTKPFLARTAADLMSTNVVTIPRDMSLRLAAHRLQGARVTGAPVVDAAGRCVGVLSATDFVAWAEKGERAARRAYDLAVCADWQIVAVEQLPEDEVSRYMTADVVTALPSVPIGELARHMLDAHIHRVIVVDRHHRPVGVVSTTDILAAVSAEAARRE